jgi:hypothetical protein
VQQYEQFWGFNAGIYLHVQLMRFTALNRFTLAGLQDRKVVNPITTSGNSFRNRLNATRAVHSSHMRCCRDTSPSGFLTFRVSFF